MATHDEGTATLDLRDRGRVLFTERKYQQALEVFTDELLKSDPLAASNAAEACLQMKEFKSAEAHALRALALDSSHIKSHSRLNRARAAMGELASAHRGLLAVPLESRADLHKVG
jgi:tetratricopeptide (TPR) repeat protein